MPFEEDLIPLIRAIIPLLYWMGIPISVYLFFVRILDLAEASGILRRRQRKPEEP